MKDKIRLFKVSTFYETYLEKIFTQSGDLKYSTYKNQYDFLMNDCFAWANFWKLNLEKTDNYIVEETVFNAAFLQKTWAKENNIKITNNWKQEIVEAQIEAFKPDIVFAEHHAIFDIEYRKYLKKKFPNIKLLITWDGIAINSPTKFQNYDLILSCLKSVTNFYQLHGFNTLYLPFAFESSILDKMQNWTQQRDVCFIGSIALFKQGHFQRLRIISELVKQIPIDLYINGLETVSQRIIGQLRSLSQGQFKAILEIQDISKNIKKSRFGIEMYNTIYNTNITLNSHIDVSENEAANIRLFEATGVGSCLVTDWKPNISDFFEEDYEIVTYKNTEECIEKIAWLIENPKQRKEIAIRGQQKTLNEHNYKNRGIDFDQMIRSII